MRRMMRRRPALRRLSEPVAHVSREQAIPILLGLEAARQTKRYFPAFWEAHGAAAPVSSQSLLGMGYAFVALLTETVDLGDLGGDLDWHITGPPHDLLLDPPDLPDGEDPWESIEQILMRAPFAVYGIDLAAEDQEQFPMLAVIVSDLLGVPVLDRALFADALEDGDAIAEVMARCPRIALGTRTGDLDYDRECLLTQLAGVLAWGEDLGQVLAYAQQVTDNPFANIGPFEAMDAQTYGAWEWSFMADEVIDLAMIAQQQEAAQALALAYARMEAHIAVFPETTIPQLAALLAEAAQAVGLTVRAASADLDAGWADDEEDEEDEEDDDFTETEEDDAWTALATAP